MEYAYFNDEIIEESSAVFNLNERVLRLGDGFFESIRVENNKAIWAKLHFERLVHTAKLVRIILDENFTFHKFESIISLLISKNKLPHARLRCVLYRKGGGQYNPIINNAGIFITVEGLGSPKNIIDKVGIFNEVKKNISVYSEIKSCSAFLYTIASIYAKEQNLDDVLIFNEKNRICETSKSNIFIMKDDSIITPSLSEGCIGGIIRRVLIDHLQVKEKRILYEDLKTADAVFCTNAIGEIQPIFKIDESCYDLNLVTPLIKKYEALKFKLNA
jgi:branched-chain amino acid aminotransferase